MKKSVAAGLSGLTCVLALVSAAPAQAQTAPAAPATEPAAPTPDWTFTGNANLYSDYRFRGFTQTGYKPAFQGGVDLAHSSGFYVGNWNSNVEQGLYRGASLEMDFYGGYKYTFLDDFTVDGGLYYYYYPTKRSNNSYGGYSQKADEGELYVSLAYKTFSIKYWYAVTNYFGLGDSFQGGPETSTKGSGYLEGNATYDLGDNWGLVGHVGYQYVKHSSDFTDANGATLPHSVIDWKVGVTKDFSGWVVALSAVGTSKKAYFGTADLEAGGKIRPMASVSKTF